MIPGEPTSPDAAQLPEEVVAFRIADFLVRTEVQRLALFRHHLGTTVVRVSPLLLDLAPMEGISLSEAVVHLRPPQDWPWRELDEMSSMQIGRSMRTRQLLRSTLRDDVRRFARVFSPPGVVIRDVTHARGRFAICPSGKVLGFTASMGPAVVSAFGSGAKLKLPEMLPATLMNGMPGRLLGDLFDHPALVGRDYKVTRVEPDLFDGLPVVEFRAPLVPFALARPAPLV
jgi:hypothetical protein